MGLAASQGRYLCLTARNSDLIYEGQQISQQRLALTQETQEVAEKYNEAMNNRLMMATTPDGGTQQLTYDILTSQDPFSGLGMRIVDLNGNVVMPGKYIETSTRDEEGKLIKERFASAQDFVNRYMSDLGKDKMNELSTYPLDRLAQFFTENYPDSEITVKFKDKTNSEMINDGERALYDENCDDPAYLQEMLKSGQWLLQQAAPDAVWEDTMYQSSSAISEVYDTSDDAAAEAEYEAAMKDIQKRDKLLELRLEEVQTEQSAIEKELESVKKIIGKNIEDSFKTFSS